MSVKHRVQVNETETEERDLTPTKAIRLKCLECSAWAASEVKDCNIRDCALYPFRLGKTGNTLNLSDEQRQSLRDRLAKARAKRKQA